MILKFSKEDHYKWLLSFVLCLLLSIIERTQNLRLLGLAVLTICITKGSHFISHDPSFLNRNEIGQYDDPDIFQFWTDFISIMSNKSHFYLFLRLHFETFYSYLRLSLQSSTNYIPISIYMYLEMQSVFYWLGQKLLTQRGRSIHHDGWKSITGWWKQCMTLLKA